MSRMLENASEVFFVLGILLTIAGVIFREIRRAKDPYKAGRWRLWWNCPRENRTRREKRQVFMTIIIRS